MKSALIISANIWIPSSILFISNNTKYKKQAR